jgi:AraC-like DNA-binding protein
LLGLKAGAAVARGDLEVLEQAANSNTTLRGAAELISRYLGIIHTGAAFSLVVERDVAAWRYAVVDGVVEPSAAHDFVVSALVNYARLYTGRDEPKLAVHFAHGDRTNLDEYRRLFRCPIKFDMEWTGVVFPAARLNWKLSQPTLALSELFEARAREKLAELTQAQTTSEIVRQTIRSNIKSGDVAMSSLARRLGMSEATLRRKLAAEETTHSEILDEIRKELALSLLERPDVPATDVACLLGFADATVFHRAFKRWTGTTPAAYRKRVTPSARPPG